MNTQQPKGDGKKTCLVCGREMTLTRGLCRAHHKHFTDSKKTIEISGGDAKAWELEVVRRGFVLADGRAPENVFMEIYEELREENLGMVSENIDKFSTSVGKPAPKPTLPKKAAEKKKGTG